jgi:hypothetical protein
LELNGLQTFLAIKLCQQTKIGKIIYLAQSSIFKLAHIYAPIGAFLSLFC